MRLAPRSMSEVGRGGGGVQDGVAERGHARVKRGGAPKYWLGPQRLENTGSKRMLSPRSWPGSGAYWRRMAAWPSHVDLTPTLGGVKSGVARGTKDAPSASSGRFLPTLAHMNWCQLHSSG